MLNDTIWYGLYGYSDLIHTVGWKLLGNPFAICQECKDEDTYRKPEDRIGLMMQGWFSLPLVIILDILSIPLFLIIVFPGLYIFMLYQYMASVFEFIDEVN